ncbi:LeuA family protein [Candidatus Electrothrix sp.]|uniref:LeuA family protein n=1 Tax=Candidatus Electrothrix sp. TaxID=2170559 RepID=UPI0040570E7B
MRINQPQLIDSTLREGEQTPSVAFTDQDKHEIIQGLCRIGVDEIELGIASPLNTYLPKLVLEARKRTADSCRLSLWCRCKPEDITFAAVCSPDLLALSVPVSDAHIQERLGKDRDWLHTTLAASIQQALAAGIPAVSVGMEDASRADIDFLCATAKIAKQYGASRIRLADTVGICSPAGMTRLVQTITSAASLPIAVHCHNDFGMATANAIAALEAGANGLDATVLGLGERAGNSRLEEVVGYLAFILNEKKYHPEFLPELCQRVAQSTGKTIADNHPLVGSAIFTCETGLHQHGITVNPDIYEPYAPERVGGTRDLRFGEKTGARAVQLQLDQAGLRLDDMQIKNLVNRIRSGGQTLNQEQLLRFAAECCSLRSSGSDTSPLAA